MMLFPDLENREKNEPEPAHVINIDIQDNHEEATIGAFMICDLCTMVSRATNNFYSRIRLLSQRRGRGAF